MNQERPLLQMAARWIAAGYTPENARRRAVIDAVKASLERDRQLRQELEEK